MASGVHCGGEDESKERPRSPQYPPQLEGVVSKDGGRFHRERLVGGVRIMSRRMTAPSRTDHPTKENIPQLHPIP